MSRHLLSLAFVAAAVAALILPFGLRRRLFSVDAPTPSEARAGLVGVGREVPLDFPPRVTFASEIPDAALTDILDMNRPQFSTVGIPLILHSARLWGRDADFPVDRPRPGFQLDRVLPGRIMLGMLRDLRVFHENGGRELETLLLEDEYGIRVVTSQERLLDARSGSTHPDKFLQVMGECGMPLSTTVTPDSGRVGTLREVLEDSLLRFSIGQELEFTATAYAHYLPPNGTWRNRFGQVCSLEDIAEALIARPFGQGACDGMHVPFALVNLRRADELAPFLSPRIRAAIPARLREYSRQLTQSQRPDGAWDHEWSGHPMEQETRWVPHIDVVAGTGHHLEWIALARTEDRPPDAAVIRAIRFLCGHIPSLRGRFSIGFHGQFPMTHAARALALHKGVDPFSFLRSHAPDLSQDSDPAPGLAGVQNRR